MRACHGSLSGAQIERSGSGFSCVPGDPGFVDEEPVAELRVVAVSIEQRIRTMGRSKIGVGDRTGKPAVVGLAGLPPDELTPDL